MPRYKCSLLFTDGAKFEQEMEFPIEPLPGDGYIVTAGNNNITCSLRRLFTHTPRGIDVEFCFRVDGARCIGEEKVQGYVPQYGWKKVP